MADEVLPELAELWVKMRPVALERCDAVRRGAGSEDAEAHAEARAEAHKLAGALGMYGLSAASDIALELDAAIVDGALDTPEGRAAVAQLAVTLRASLEAAD